MTCIVGLVQDGEVWMGADGQTVFGYVQMPCVNPKICRVGVQDDRMLIGVSGRPRIQQLIATATSHELSLHTLTEHIDPFDWLVRDFASAVHTLVQNANAMVSDDGVPVLQCHMLIALRGLLFMMDGSFGIYQTTRGFHACGGGQEVAMGSLAASSGGAAPEVRLRWALEASSQMLQGIGPPFHIEKL